MNDPIDINKIRPQGGSMRPRLIEFRLLSLLLVHLADLVFVLVEEGPTPVSGA